MHLDESIIYNHYLIAIYKYNNFYEQPIQTFLQKLRKLTC